MPSRTALSGRTLRSAREIAQLMFGILIPLIRHGFPVIDRIGHTLFPTVGYAGGMRLAEQFLNAILDRQDRDSSEEAFELVM